MKQTELINAIKKELKSKLIKENLEILDSQPESDYDLEDQIGNFWIVKKAIKESTEEDMICETDVFGLAEMISKGLTKESIVGLYKAEGKARTTSRKMLKARDGELKEDIKTGTQQLKDLDLKMASIKADIQAKTQQGMDNPGQRDSITSDLQPLYQKLSKLEDLKTRLGASLSKEKPTKEKLKNEDE
jgi:hypothetical protein